MNDMFNDNADIEWTCTELDGVACLVLQATGPVMSASFLQGDFKALQLRYMFEPGKLPNLIPDTFICFEGKDIHMPLLACDPDPLLKPLDRAIKRKAPWILMLQYKVQGDKYTRVFLTEGEVTRPMTPEPLPRWLCHIHEGQEGQ